MPKGIKLHPQNQVFRLLYAKHKCLSIILIWGVVVDTKKKSLFVFYFSSLGKTDMELGKRWLFSNGNGVKIWPLEKGRKSPGIQLTLCLLVSSADKLCKQFGSRSGPTKGRA